LICFFVPTEDNLTTNCLGKRVRRGFKLSGWQLLLASRSPPTAEEAGGGGGDQRETWQPKTGPSFKKPRNAEKRIYHRFSLAFRNPRVGATREEGERAAVVVVLLLPAVAPDNREEEE
jgi:hypothetical protein